MSIIISKKLHISLKQIDKPEILRKLTINIYKTAWLNNPLQQNW